MCVCVYINKKNGVKQTGLLMTGLPRSLFYTKLDWFRNIPWPLRSCTFLQISTRVSADKCVRLWLYKTSSRIKYISLRLWKVKGDYGVDGLYIRNCDLASHAKAEEEVCLFQLELWASFRSLRCLWAGNLATLVTEITSSGCASFETKNHSKQAVSHPAQSAYCSKKKKKSC